MMAKGLGLMWEEWRRTRNALLVIMLVLACFAALIWGMDNREHMWPLAALAAYGVFGLIVYLLLAQSTRSNIGAGVPFRRFRLPVSSFDLAFWPLLYRLAVVGVGAGFVALIGRLIRPDFQVVTPLFILWLIFSALHTLAYASSLLGKWLPILLACLMLFPGVLVFVNVYDAPTWRYPQYDLAGMAIAAGAALAATTAAIAITRGGGWNFGRVRRNAAARRDVPEHTASGRRLFASVNGAQRWFEWRSISKSVIILMVGLTLAFLLSEGSSNAFDAERQYTISGTLGMIIFVVNSAAAGLWAFANQAARTRGNVSMFVQTRPVSDFHLARGKIEAAVVLILANLAVVTLVLLVMSVLLGLAKYGEGWVNVFRVEWEWRHLLLALAILGLAWIAYWRGPVLAAFLIALAVYTESAPHHFARWIYDAGVIKPAPLAFMAASLILLAIPFLRAYRRNIFSSSALAAITAVWAAVTALAAFLFLHCFVPDFSATSASLISAVLTLLALTPFATVPLRVARARHQ